MGSFIGKHLGIRPPGVIIYRVIPYYLVLHFEEIPSCFVLNVFWGYFALINGPNCEVIWIIPLFGVIFGENLGIWPPGVTIYGFNPYCFPINFEEISPCFVLDVFCVHFSLSNGPNWEVICIIPIVWVIFGYLTPLGDHI